MATFGQYLAGAGQGALSGATAGVAIGAGAGALPGAIVGGALGILGAGLDAKQAAEMEEALRQAEEEYENAQNQFNQQVLQSGAAAREAVQQSMAAKAAADSTAIDSATADAQQQADASGLIGAEKADFVLKTRQAIERERSSSSPAALQQALGGAKQNQALGLQKAALGLQSANTRYQTDIQQISGQELGSASGAIGQALGGAAQVGGALRGAGVDPLTGKAIAGTGSKSDAAAPGTGRGTREVVGELGTALKTAGPFDEGSPIEIGGGPPADMTGPEWERSSGRIRKLNQSRGAAKKLKLGGELGPVATPSLDDITIGAEGNLIENPPGVLPTFTQPEATAPFGRHTTREWLPVTDANQYRAYATGGVAGLNGPEVASVGEQGPELVLNAQQTQQLAQALPGSTQRGPSQPTSPSPLGAAPSPAPANGPRPSKVAQTPEELEAYMQELLQRLG